MTILNPHYTYHIPSGTILRKELEITFKNEVTDNASKIDPSQEQDWYSLILGWALAKGLSPKDAHDFALYIRYETELA